MEQRHLREDIPELEDTFFLETDRETQDRPGHTAYIKHACFLAAWEYLEFLRSRNAWTRDSYISKQNHIISRIYQVIAHVG
jgi:hypothetical protein